MVSYLDISTTSFSVGIRLYRTMKRTITSKFVPHYPNAQSTPYQNPITKLAFKVGEFCHLSNSTTLKGQFHNLRITSAHAYKLRKLVEIAEKIYFIIVSSQLKRSHMDLKIYSRVAFIARITLTCIFSSLA